MPKTHREKVRVRKAAWDYMIDYLAGKKSTATDAAERAKFTEAMMAIKGVTTDEESDWEIE